MTGICKNEGCEMCWVNVDPLNEATGICPPFKWKRIKFIIRLDDPEDVCGVSILIGSTSEASIMKAIYNHEVRCGTEFTHERKESSS